METILIIDDEEDLCRTLEKVLTKEGYRVIWTTSPGSVLSLMQTESPCAALLDLKLGNQDGLAVLKEIREKDPHLPVIMLTAYETVKTAVEAMKQGAFHYMPKPFDNEELKTLLDKAITQRRLYDEMNKLRTTLGESETLKMLMGQSEKIQEVIKLIHSVAPTNVNVLLLGESGTGKELAANAIHHLSKRANGPFIPVDCAAIPETLIESELFGHEKGSFTGAVSSQPGHFEMADGGTIFLDEIGNIPPSVQSKLLRFLETHELKRVGGRKPIKTSVRVIAATNIDLARSSKENGFRLDLLYRLNEFPIHLPPLRERPEDIHLLCAHFVAEFGLELEKKIEGITPEALERLQNYSFPGNVRELRNALKRASVIATGQIEVANLPLEVCQPEKKAPLHEITLPLEPNLPLLEASRRIAIQVEKSLIQNALHRTQGHYEEAARLLGISRKTLYNKVKEYGV
ncbi:MAG: sigma-54-dependent Fis family transcriptional regulator [Deltaproteobacteria bacterium]|nr:sigma-54-dependent Fis family transcriptional regulator [Deltaproteobacteria bacterium]